MREAAPHYSLVTMNLADKHQGNVWCGGGCVPWSFDAQLCVDTFSVECSVTHHSIAQL